MRFYSKLTELYVHSIKVVLNVVLYLPPKSRRFKTQHYARFLFKKIELEKIKVIKKSR